MNLDYLGGWSIERRLPIGEGCSLQLCRQAGTGHLMGLYRDEDAGQTVPESVRRFGTNVRAAVAWFEAEKAKIEV